MKNLVLILAILLTIGLTAQNPSSTNYTLVQFGIGSGSDPGNPPTSANFELAGSAMGVVSDVDASSASYILQPGYYTGIISGEILPPENVVISADATTVSITWDAVPGATSYKIYSSDLPATAFTEDTSGSFVSESWSAPITTAKKFYYVTAVN